MNTVRDIAAGVALVIGCCGMVVLVVLGIIQRRSLNRLKDKAAVDENARETLIHIEKRVNDQRPQRLHLLAISLLLTAIGASRFI